ncbi:unnamed protein product [Alternaria alternata]
MEVLGLGRAGCFVAIVTARIVAVLLALVPIKCFKGFHFGLAAFKGMVVVTICVIMFYVEERVGNPPTDYVRGGSGYDGRTAPKPKLDKERISYSLLTKIA